MSCKPLNIVRSRPGCASLCPRPSGSSRLHWATLQWPWLHQWCFCGQFAEYVQDTGRPKLKLRHWQVSYLKSFGAFRVFCCSQSSNHRTVQAKLPMKYAYLMALDVLDLLKQEKSLQRVAVPPGSKTFAFHRNGQKWTFTSYFILFSAQIDQTTNNLKPWCLEFEGPWLRITVVGDLHGQYFDFVHMIEQVTGKPNPQNPILFNGDFVDRGPWSVEVLLCLYAFKLQYPTAVHFNRGNHESEMTNYQCLEEKRSLWQLSRNIYLSIEFLWLLKLPNPLNSFLRAQGMALLTRSRSSMKNLVMISMISHINGRNCLFVTASKHVPCKSLSWGASTPDCQWEAVERERKVLPLVFGPWSDFQGQIDGTLQRNLPSLATVFLLKVLGIAFAC